MSLGPYVVRTESLFESNYQQDMLLTQRRSCFKVKIILNNKNIVPALALLLASMSLMSCGGSPAASLLARVDGQPQSPERFGVCKSYGCQDMVMTSLSPREWARIEAVFEEGAPDAAAERALIARAIGVMEEVVGPKTGTEADEPGAAIINFSRHGQMDCIDEAFNTTLYLRMMAGAGLLVWHEVGDPARRGYLFDGWPHNTATLVERETGLEWAVDSWFHGNGAPAEVVTLRIWRDGWVPDNVPAGSARDQ